MRTARPGAAAAGKDEQSDKELCAESEVAEFQRVLEDHYESRREAQAELAEARAQVDAAAMEAQHCELLTTDIRNMRLELVRTNAELAGKQRAVLEVQRRGAPSKQQLQRELRRCAEEIKRLASDHDGLTLNLRTVTEEHAALKCRAAELTSECQAFARPPASTLAERAEEQRRVASEELRAATSELTRESEAALAARARDEAETLEAREAEAAVLSESRAHQAQRQEAYEVQCQEVDRAAEEARAEVYELQGEKERLDQRAQELEREAALNLRAERKAKEQADRSHKEILAASAQTKVVANENEALSRERISYQRFALLLVVLAVAVLVIMQQAPVQLAPQSGGGRGP